MLVVPPVVSLNTSEPTLNSVTNNHEVKSGPFHATEDKPRIATAINGKAHTGFTGHGSKEFIQGDNARLDGNPRLATIQLKRNFDFGFLGRSFDRTLSIQGQ